MIGDNETDGFRAVSVQRMYCIGDQVLGSLETGHRVNHLLDPPVAAPDDAETLADDAIRMIGKVEMHVIVET